MATALESQLHVWHQQGSRRALELSLEWQEACEKHSFVRTRPPRPTEVCVPLVSGSDIIEILLVGYSPG